MPDPARYDLYSDDDDEPSIDRGSDERDAKRPLTVHDAHVLHCSCTIENFDLRCARLRAALRAREASS